MTVQPWGQAPTPWGGPELDDDLSGYDWGGDPDDDGWDDGFGDGGGDGDTHECGCPVGEHCRLRAGPSWLRRLAKLLRRGERR